MPDIHDYLDIHRNIRYLANRLQDDVVAGRYRTGTPEFVTLEKKDGIARRMAVPDPNDALVLQCVVDTLEPQIKSAQTSTHSYYSRSHMPLGVERVDGTFAYPWWQLWPEFQSRIFQFANTHKFIVVTDIANYYDTIPLGALRNAVASASQISERVLDLLFFILEALVWRPYYMPHSDVGLPQLNFDAPRLLAHAYLFRVDEHLEQATGGTFVRWMDDIDAGVSTREAGKILLRGLQAVLNSQSLQLNAAKTRILSAREAVEHFNIRHNRALTVISNGSATPPSTPAIAAARRAALRVSYKKFRRAPRVGHWEKVQKRYLTKFGDFRDAYAVRNVRELLSNFPGTRGAALAYLSRLGYSKTRMDVLAAFVNSGDCADDGSFFEVARVLVDWMIPAKHTANVLKLADVLAQKVNDNPAFPFGAALWIFAKYATPQRLADFVRQRQGQWQHSGWASRQVAALAPRYPAADRQQFLRVLQDNGLLQGLQVWANLNRMSNETKLDNQLRKYMTHVPAQGVAFPLPKVVLAVALLSGKLSAAEKTSLRAHLVATLQDPRYRLIVSRAR